MATTLTPFLWFDDQLADALAFYTDVFDESVVISSTNYPEGTPAAGSLMMATFRLAGQELMGLNGGPSYALTPAFSLFLSCDTADEVDHYWDRLVEGGQPLQCGWLTDRFGLSWQVVPRLLGTLMSDPDPERVGRVTAAMLAMVKIDSAALQRAYDGV